MQNGEDPIKSYDEMLEEKDNKNAVSNKLVEKVLIKSAIIAMILFYAIVLFFCYEDIASGGNLEVAAIQSIEIKTLKISAEVYATMWIITMLYLISHKNERVLQHCLLTTFMYIFLYAINIVMFEEYICRNLL